MKSIKQQHAEVAAGLKANMDAMRPYLSKNVLITMKDGEERVGKCNAIGTYFMTIQGVNGTFDESLKGKTKILYNEISKVEKEDYSTLFL